MSVGKFLNSKCCFWCIALYASKYFPTLFFRPDPVLCAYPETLLPVDIVSLTSLFGDARMTADCSWPADLPSLKKKSLSETRCDAVRFPAVFFCAKAMTKTAFWCSARKRTPAGYTSEAAILQARFFCTHLQTLRPVCREQGSEARYLVFEPPD